MPKDVNSFFDGVELNLIDWIRQYSPTTMKRVLPRFPGKMLFSETSAQTLEVLSLARKALHVLQADAVFGHILILDEPTNHQDLESITAVNNG
jgi:ATPase subunit of ABC transporter with duplicated ATPase domains